MIRSEERPTRLTPQRHKRYERPLPSLRAFLRGAGRVTSAGGRARRANREQHQGALQRVSVCARKIGRPVAGSRRTWSRFGRYLERDEANRERAGFTSDQEQVPVSDQLRGWQKSGDERMVSVILSPEHELNLKQFTREWVERMERETGVKLDWVAAVHTNTAHPHVHVVFRERDHRFSDRDLRERMRQSAREVATEFLGYRAGKHPEHERTRERGLHKEQERV
jgi:hypothetical protein